MHSKAKQTERPEFVAEKGLLQGHASRLVAFAYKVPSSSRVSMKHFKSQVREGVAGYVISPKGFIKHF